MNIITTVQNGFSARLFAAVTIVSLLLTAFPVAFFVAQAAVQNVTINVTMVPNPGPGGTETITLTNNTAGFDVTIENLSITDNAGTVRPASDLTIAAGASQVITVSGLNNTGGDTVTFAGTNVLSSPSPVVSYTNSPAVGEVINGSFVITADDGVVIDPSVTSSSLYTNPVQSGFGGFAVDFEMNNFTTVTSVKLDAYRAGDTASFAELNGKPKLITEINDVLPANTRVVRSAPFVVSPALNAAQQTSISSNWILPNVVWTPSDVPAKVVITVEGTNSSDEAVTRIGEVTNLLNNGSAARPFFADLFPAPCTDQVDAGLSDGPVQNISTGDYFNTIQNAINDCDTQNTHTIVANDGYTEEVVAVTKEVTIQGPQTGVSGTSAVRTGGEATVNHFDIRANNVTIDGFSIPGSDTFPRSSDSGQSGIYLAGSDKVSVINNRMIYFGDLYTNDPPTRGTTNSYVGIHTSAGAEDLLIEDNYLANWGDAVYVNKESSVVFTENIVQDNLFGVSLQSVKSITITNNTFSGNWPGIRTSSFSTERSLSENVVVTNNDFVGNKTGIISYDGTAFDARSNWWGTTDGPVATSDINDYNNNIFTWTNFVIPPSDIGTDPWLCGPFEDEPVSSVDGVCPVPAVDPNDEHDLSLSGFKFHNRDSSNRKIDEGEEKLPGWEFRLYKEGAEAWELLSTTVTDANGDYKFPSQKAPGTYHVCEVSQLGWTQVFQDWSTYNVSTDNESPNVAEEGAYCATTVYTDEKDRSRKSFFGNVSNDLLDEHQFTFSGYKFDNKNEDRDRDIGEARLYDWDFNMYKEVDGVWEYLTTTSVQPADAAKNAGKFVFPQRKDAGIYHVCEVAQAGWTQVRQDWAGTPFHIITDNLSPNETTEGPYCATAVYDDSADRSKAANFGNVQDPVTLADVTMCKVDQSDNGLADWTLMLQGTEIGTYEVPANSAAGVDTADLQAGMSHIALANGTWDNNRGVLNIVDAEYSTEDNWVNSIMDGFTGFGTDILELFVGGTNGDWGPYSSTHQYAQSFVPATNGPMNLAINDSNHGDNTGSLDVTVFTGFAGVTEGNGCVTFTDVPYGQYTVAEVQQDGWRNVSGLGSVTVDANTQQFEVVNTDALPPLANSCSYVSDIAINTTPAQDNVQSNITAFTLNDNFYISGDEFDLFVDGDTNADAPFRDRVVMERTPTGLEVFFYGSGQRTPVKEFSGSFMLNGVDLTEAKIEVGPDPIEATGAWPDTFTIDKTTGEVTFKLFTNSGNDSFVISGLRPGAGDCDDSGSDPNPNLNPDPATYTISGFKYNDANGNGVQDDGEVGAAGWTMTATAIGWNESSPNVTAVTNENGFYTMTVPAGEWTVSEEDRGDWTQTAVFQNNDLVSPGAGMESCSFNLNNDVIDTRAVCNFLNQPDADDGTGTGTGTGNGTGTETEETETPAPSTATRNTGSGTQTDRFSLPTAPVTPFVGAVLGATTDSCPFLLEFMQMGANNEEMEVMKLQAFLNIFRSLYGGTENPVTGTFGIITDANVKKFQETYKADILEPWFNQGIVSHTKPTGFVYKTTLWKINSLVCSGSAALPDLSDETLDANVDKNAPAIRD